MADLLSPRQAAEILGVSESTVRRWVDDARLPARRTHGKHRRIERTALLAFARREGLGITPSVTVAAGRGGRVAPPAELADRLYELVIGGSDAASQLVIEAVQHNVAAEVISDQVIAPAMRRIGDDWETGAVSIYREHAATQLVHAAISAGRAALAPPSPGAPRALSAALSGDPYSLAPALAAFVLHALDYDALFIGPDTPAAEVCRSIAELGPRLVALSISSVGDPERLTRDLAAIGEAAPSLAVGGRALSRELAVAADCRGATMKDLADFARQLVV